MTTPTLGLALSNSADTLATALLTKFNGNMSSLDTIIGNKVDKGSPISNLIATTGSAGTVPLVAKGTLSQSANFFEARNSSDTVLASIDPIGIITGNATRVTNTAAATVALIVKGAASQSANLQEWQNSSGTVGSAILAAGTGAYFTDRITVGTTDALRSQGSLSGGTAIAAHTTYASGVGIVVKGFASQTANLQEWLNSSGTVLAQITSLGRYVQGSVIGAEMDITIPTNNTGLVIKGAASQGANLQEWRNSSGTVLGSVNNAGGLTVTAAGGGSYGSAFGGSPISSVVTSVFTNNAGNKGLVVQGAASQSANLQEWQNSSGTVIVNIGSLSGTVALNIAEPPGLSANDSGLAVNFSVVGNRRVLCGAVDSAGAGFRTLRIGN